MLIKSVSFPEPLISAQRDGSLVVFAGAGVSMGPPSKYPDFQKLSETITGERLTKKEKERIDVFLGRHEKRGIKVHLKTKEILSNPASKPNVLHKSLVNLFPRPNAVRIVTTNFDRHFSTVAKEKFGISPEIYYAPALPLGEDFNGIIYLHGSVDKDENRMVLTDSDFGRAYLTDGWATKFLRAMFQKYTVLFIGYSHNDPVMHYLSRGLPVEDSKNRFAFTREGNTEYWEYLSIECLSYPPGRSYKPLEDAVAGWETLVTMGTLDHENRIKSIVESEAIPAKEDEDYVLHALSDLTTVRFFTRYAKSIVWLHWAERNKLFERLFIPEQPASDIDVEIAYWFAREFIIQYTDETLSLIQRKGQRLNPVLWSAIAYKLHAIDNLPDHITFAKLVNVLLHSSIPRNEFLDYLLNKCRFPEDCNTALLLFRCLTEPRLNLSPSFSFTGSDSAEKIDYEVTMIGEDYWLREVWEKKLLPNLSELSILIEPIITDNLQQAHILLRSVGKANSIWDPNSYGRSAIEAHEQDRYPKEIDILIDAAREVLRWLLINEPIKATGIIEGWFKSGVPILKRLAIYGVTEDTHLRPDDKIKWLLERDLLYNLGLKYEVFHLLKETFPKATEPTRSNVLKEALIYPGLEEDEEHKDVKQYEIYNLLYWLHDVAPECRIAAEQFESMQKAHPDFGKREHPDLSHWSSGVTWMGPRSPKPVEELLSKDPEEYLDYLLNFKGDQFRGPDREGLLSTVTEAVTKDYSWGKKLAQVLAKDNKWDADLWKYLVQGWHQLIDSEDNLKEALGFIKAHPQLNNFSNAISDLLQMLVKQKHNKISIDALMLAESIADQLWNHIVLKDEKNSPEVSDWLSLAINRPGGKLAEFWLHALSRRRALAGEDWAGIPGDYRTYFDKIIRGTTQHGELGRVLLASQVHFLFSLDLEWTKTNIIPLFDWHDSKKAEQAWNGFLFWGRWSEALLPDILPLYVSSVPHLPTELINKRDRFASHLAEIALYSSINPLIDGWLLKFIKNAEPIDRRNWARYFGFLLRSPKGDAIRNVWERWLKEYWHQRNRGVPVPLDSEEKKEMVEWSAYLGPVFDDVVNKICENPAPSIKHTGLFHDLNKTEYAVDNPVALTKLLLHLLPNIRQGTWFCGELEKIVEGLAKSAIPLQVYNELCNELARLGCPNAASVKNKKLGN